jgi:hypothetical protein
VGVPSRRPAARRARARWWCGRTDTGELDTEARAQRERSNERTQRGRGKQAHTGTHRARIHIRMYVCAVAHTHTALDIEQACVVHRAHDNEQSTCSSTLGGEGRVRRFVGVGPRRCGTRFGWWCRSAAGLRVRGWQLGRVAVYLDVAAYGGEVLRRQLELQVARHNPPNHRWPGRKIGSSFLGRSA